MRDPVDNLAAAALRGGGGGMLYDEALASCLGSSLDDDTEPCPSLQGSKVLRRLSVTWCNSSLLLNSMTLALQDTEQPLQCPSVWCMRAIEGQPVKLWSETIPEVCTTRLVMGAVLAGEGVCNERCAQGP